MKMHLLLAFAFSWTLAHATSFFIHPFSQFTRNANLIIRGTTTNVHAEYASSPTGEKTIFTYSDLNIREVVKGEFRGSMIKIRRLGGTLDGVSLAIPSSVEFNENEEGVFFLSEVREDGSYEVTGMELGKFNLEKSGGKEVLKGGLFAYSQGHTDEDGHNHNPDQQRGDLSENQRAWSFSELKDLVQKQGGAPAVQESNSAPKTEEKPEITSIYKENPSLKPLTQPETAEQKTPEINAPQNSPLYFDSTLWYSLAILFLTLGIYTIVRRR